MARGYGLWRIGAELFWPDFAAEKRGGADGEAGDEGERAGCGAGIKTPDKSSKRAGSPAGRQPAGGGVVPSLQVMG